MSLAAVGHFQRPIMRVDISSAGAAHPRLPEGWALSVPRHHTDCDCCPKSLLTLTSHKDQKLFPQNKQGAVFTALKVPNFRVTAGAQHLRTINSTSRSGRWKCPTQGGKCLYLQMDLCLWLLSAAFSVLVINALCFSRYLFCLFCLASKKQKQVWVVSSYGAIILFLDAF